jgi:putative ABC transport system ATP-binding protein
MRLLALEHVCRRYRHGAQERTVLHDVCLHLDAGEMVAIWGARRSGRSTLLRVAAGIEPIDGGTVRFEGVDISARGSEMLGSGIGYCQRSARGAGGFGVLEQMLVGLLAQGVPSRVAKARAAEALERVGAGHCASRTMQDLDSAEETRVAIARALALEPSLLLIDEPVKGVDLLERDGILALLRTLASGGASVLLSTGEATALSNTDRALTLADGQLRGRISPELAQVLPLRRQASL